MNKRNIFSLVALMSVATLSMAGIFHESDKCHTRVTGRRKFHCDEQDRQAAQERKHPGRSEKRTTKTSKTTKNGKVTRSSREEVRSGN